MNTLTRIRDLFRRPLIIHLHDTQEHTAAALHGLARFIAHRHGLDGKRIRIDLTITNRPREGRP